ncbi:Translation initiation factor eIF-2B subunit gamma [Oleoguttula sp. CCFEE 5521]
MPHATHPSPGLQAFILCGPGVSLNTFTSSPKDFPKALVPIANRPMVWYPLDWCHRMGITDVTLITPPESAAPLQGALSIHPALTSVIPRPEILAPADLTQTTGAGEILRLPEVQKAITGDFMILPCDLVSEVEGSKVVEQWLALNPLSVSSKTNKRKSGMGVFYPTQGVEGISHKKDETDFIVTVLLPSPNVPAPAGSLRPDIEELVMSMPTDTLKDLIEEDKETSLRIRQSLFTKHGRVKIKTKHRDAHVYIFPQWVKEFAAKNEKFDSISEDLLGWWSKASWQGGLGAKLGLDEVLQEKAATGREEYSESNDDNIDIASLSSTTSARQPYRILAFASRVNLPASPATVISAPPPLLAYIQPSLTPSTATPSPTQPLIRRIDTTSALLNTSLYLARQPSTHPLAHEHKLHPSAIVGMQSRVSQEDSLIAENVKLGTRVNVKETVIGPNCEIGNNARLIKCLLMDGVVVGDGVQLTGCIIGRRAKVEGVKAESEAGGESLEGAKKGKGKGRQGDGEEGKTRLVECEVAPGFIVESGTQGKGEKYMAFEGGDGMEEFDEDGDEGMDEDL